MEMGNQILGKSMLMKAMKEKLVKEVLAYFQYFQLLVLHGSFKMKQNLNSLFLFFSLMFFSCEFNDQEIEYQEKIVVFGSIVANMPITDTVTVSRSASISEDILAQDLWINDAEVL